MASILKNYLIISSFTGLRIEDMVHLNELEVETKTKDRIKYDYFITEIRKAKDKGIPLKVAIPILQPVRDLLDKNENRFPKFPSKQNIRKNIKRFLKYLDFNEEIKVLIHYYNQPIGEPIFKPQYDVFTPHDCRSTFITNLREMAIPDSIVEPITHPKVTKSVFKSYDKSSVIEKMMLFVNELNLKNSDIYSH
jgi:integrase